MTPHQFFPLVQDRVTAVVSPQVKVLVGEDPESFTVGYVIIWPSPGTALDDRTIDGRMGAEATDLSFQVTAASHQSVNLLRILQDVNTALTDARVGGRLIQPDTIINRAVTPLQDDTVRPVRHYMATTWHTTLTRSTTDA